MFKKIAINFFLVVQFIYAQSVSLDSITTYIEQARKDWHVPGLAVAIVQNDSVVLARGFGQRELGKTQPVDEHTLFAVASNTKAFTVGLLGRLVDRALLNWDDKVVYYLPDFHMYDPYVTKEMTIRDLLTHRSGLPTFGGDHIWIGNSLPPQEILHRLKYLQPIDMFRASYHYQNLLYMVAGLVYEKITGESWGASVQKHFFEPLEMQDANTNVVELTQIANVATPHEIRHGQIIKVPYDNLENIAPAAAINASVSDMSKWMRLHLNVGRFNGQQLLSESVVREMQAIYNPIPVTKFAEEELKRHFFGVGMGWFISDYNGTKIVSHSGGMSGMISLQTLVPEENLGVFVATNLAPDAPTFAITMFILDAFLKKEGLPRDWSRLLLARLENRRQKEQEKEQYLQRSRIKGTKPTLPLKKYTGTYFEPFSGNATVKMEDGNLVFDYNPRHSGSIEHWHGDVFRVTWRNPIFDMPPQSFIKFFIDEYGEIEALEVSFYDPIIFKRVKTTEK